jgi:hypothetical protein
MNGLRDYFAIIAICAPCIVLTGCGGDDDNSPAPAANPNPDSAGHAPERLNGNGYALRGVEGTASAMEFAAGADTFRVTSESMSTNYLVTGAFTAQRHGDVWTVQLSRDDSTNTSQIALTFTGPGQGTYSWTSDGIVYPGTFAPLAITTPPPREPGEHEPEPGPGPGLPTSLSSITVTVGPGSPIAEGAVYAVNFSGGTAGTFTTVNAQGESMGSGTYTYTPDGDHATLIMNYPELQNDQDNMRLTFLYPPGTGQPNPFTGTQTVSGAQYAFNGTFTY